jgi:hypothetical protein
MQGPVRKSHVHIQIKNEVAESFMYYHSKRFLADLKVNKKGFARDAKPFFIESQKITSFRPFHHRVAWQELLFLQVLQKQPLQ